MTLTPPVARTSLWPTLCQALTELGLVQNIRHVAAISGGAWALSAWMYYQPGSTPEAARNDAELLGEVRLPVILRNPRFHTSLN